MNEGLCMCGFPNQGPLLFCAKILVVQLYYRALGFELIEVLNLNPAVKKAIILLLYHTFVKVLKDALAHWGPYQTLTKLWGSDPGGENTVSSPATIQI